MIRRAYLGCGAAFALGLALYVVFGAWVDLLVFVVAAPLLLALAIFAVAFSGFVALKSRRRDAFFVCAATATLLLAWRYLPTREIGTSVRFELQRAQYEAAGAAVAAGKIPDCAPVTCAFELSPHRAVVFPWGGLLAAWQGVVYDPTDDMQAFMERKPSFTAAVTGCTRLRPGFYICGFA